MLDTHFNEQMIEHWRIWVVTVTLISGVCVGEGVAVLVAEGKGVKVEVGLGVGVGVTVGYGVSVGVGGGRYNTCPTYSR